MGWGDNWGNSSWGSKWGGGSSRQHENKDPEGTHNASCIAGNTLWGNSGKTYYDEKCSGCRHDRAKAPWGSTSGSSGVIKALPLVGGAFVAKKSLWG